MSRVDLALKSACIVCILMVLVSVSPVLAEIRISTCSFLSFESVKALALSKLPRNERDSLYRIWVNTCGNINNILAREKAKVHRAFVTLSKLRTFFLSCNILTKLLSFIDNEPSDDRSSSRDREVIGIHEP